MIFVGKRSKKSRVSVVLLILMCVSWSTMPVMAKMTEQTLVGTSQLFVPGKVIINGASFDNTVSFLDFNKAQIASFEEFKEEIAQFPLLQKVEMCDCNLTNEQLGELQKAYPEVKFVWNIKLKNYWTVRTDQVAFSTNKGKAPLPYLTNADVEQLKYCTDLVALDLGHNGISDISFVKYMPNLRILILVDNAVRDLTPLETCKNLVYLETFVNPITDITPLTNLVNLTDVNICYNYFTDIQPLLNKPNLERLFVSHTGLSMSQIRELQAEYPDVQINYTVTQSIDGGWRKVEKFTAMRNMYKTNTVSSLFLTNIDRLEYYHTVFDAEYYMDHYPDVVEKVGTDAETLLDYFITYGVVEGQKASPAFWVVDYALEHPELTNENEPDYKKVFQYYMTRGYKETL